MFKKKDAPKEKNMGGAPTLLGPNTSFEGRFLGHDSICIEGEFRGELINESSVFINKSGRVQADVKARNVFVHGDVEGNIRASENLNIGPSGRVRGDVDTRSLTVVTGGRLDGNCRMLDENGEVISESQGIDSPVSSKASLFQSLDIEDSADEGQSSVVEEDGIEERQVIDPLNDIMSLDDEEDENRPDNESEDFPEELAEEKIQNS
jgi:cytoskeletal protein CcmA (bactofilin family)